MIGFELTLSHDDNIEFILTDKSIISDYQTSGNTTKMIIVTEVGNELFSSTGDFEIIDVIAGSAQSEIEYSISIVPEKIGLGKAYPNPFNPVTSFELAIPQDGFVTVKVYNVMGQMVSTIHEGNLTANSYTFNWNASDVSSGIYLLKAETSSNVEVQKVMLMK